MSTQRRRVRFGLTHSVGILAIISAGAALAAAAAPNMTTVLSHVPAPPATAADAIARTQNGTDRLVTPVMREAEALQVQVSQPAGGAAVSPQDLAKMTREQQMAYAMKMAQQQSAGAGAGLGNPQLMA